MYAGRDLLPTSATVNLALCAHTARSFFSSRAVAIAAPAVCALFYSIRNTDELWAHIFDCVYMRANCGYSALIVTMYRVDHREDELQLYV